MGRSPHKSAARRPQDICWDAPSVPSKIRDRRRAAGRGFCRLLFPVFFKKISAKNFPSFLKKKPRQKILAGCAPAFLKKSSAKNFSRLRREQWDSRCAHTGCAAFYSPEYGLPHREN
ncbi:hypothetical protein B5F10_18805 [Anaerotruncus colihominis]|uniref:Uncharacterized protein n=1 Tax=Anaerotruncus colihominis TaxID=169435 RepID=A0A1Y4MQK1_9FIRM|nr:hypothetical protein B5F11_19025 [Anaerotruncus colihominis]OUP70530.1 hypothetical protein B5F10_18805 [Anaerotruncus colihominis]